MECIIYNEFVYAFLDARNTSKQQGGYTVKIIGLTGPSGSGKSSCYEIFDKINIPCIDADEVYHNLLIPPSECADELVSVFTPSILNIDGEVDRKKLSEIVFFDESGKTLAKLNEITHKYVIRSINCIIAQHKRHNKNAVVIDAPLLFESGIDKTCDFTIAIISDEKTRISRIIERDSLDSSLAKARTKAQKPIDFYTSRATYTVMNNLTINDLNNKIHDILKLENLTD